MLGSQLGFELQDVYKPHLPKNVLNMMYLAQALMKTLYYDLFLSPDLNQRSVLEIPKVNKLCSQFEKAPKKKITSAGTQCILSGE